MSIVGLVDGLLEGMRQKTAGDYPEHLVMVGDRTVQRIAKGLSGMDLCVDIEAAPVVDAAYVRRTLSRMMCPQLRDNGLGKAMKIASVIHSWLVAKEGNFGHAALQVGLGYLLERIQSSKRSYRMLCCSQCLGRGRAAAKYVGLAAFCVSAVYLLAYTVFQMLLMLLRRGK